MATGNRENVQAKRRHEPRSLLSCRSRKGCPSGRNRGDFPGQGKITGNFFPQKSFHRGTRMDTGDARSLRELTENLTGNDKKSPPKTLLNLANFLDPTLK